MKSEHLDTLIYGAGSMGQTVLVYMRSKGIEPIGFIDRRADSLRMIDGVPVFDIQVASKKFSIDQTHVVIAAHSFNAPVAEMLDALQAAGFYTVSTFWQFCKQENWLPPISYWLAPAFNWESAEDSIQEVRGLLADQMSCTIFDQQLALRRNGDYRGLQAPRMIDQYVPSDLPRWLNPVRIVDCGAYDGDTLRMLLQHGYSIEDAIAFEPDTANFLRLQDWLQTFGQGQAICAGAYDCSGELRFAGGGNGASHIDSDGGQSIRVKMIDEVCRDFSPNLIKMDIEGAEAAALNGAKATIAKYRPALAISIYHRPEDLWTIPLQIHSFDLGYRFYIRTHGYNGFDTVLYAFAR